MKNVQHMIGEMTSKSNRALVFLVGLVKDSPGVLDKELNSVSILVETCFTRALLGVSSCRTVSSDMQFFCLKDLSVRVCLCVCVDVCVSQH